MPSDQMKVRFGRDVSPRKRQILEIAAQLFARKGSLYHHIKSKDALFVELHNAALDMAADRIDAAVAQASDPWSRLEAACIALLEIQADADSLTFPLMNDFREVPREVRRQLIERRDAFEKPFRNLVDALPLPSDIDRSIYRILLLSQLNSAAHWYKPGRLSLVDIGRQLVRIFRHT